MAMNNMGMGFVFTAQNLAHRTFKGVQRDLVQTAKTADATAARVDAAMRKLKQGAIVAGVGVVGLATAFKLAGAAGKFEMGLAGVAAVSRATSAEMEMLSKRALQAGKDTQFSPTEAVEGLHNLAVQGFSAAEAAEALGPALDLAAGGQIPVAQAAMTTAAALRAFGLQTDQATITADKLLRISNATALQANDLQLALGTVARGAGLAKQSIDEMLPSVGLVKNTGVDASVAASSVSSALIFMAKQGAKFKELGVKVTDATGKFRPFLDIILETEKALTTKYSDAAERTAKATKLFGRFGVSAYQAISSQAQSGIRSATGEILKGAAAIEYLRSQMKNAGGAAAEFREKLLDTYEGQKILLKGSIQTAAVIFGRPFAAVFKPIVSILIRVVNLIAGAFEKIPGPVQKAVAAFVIAMSTLLTFVGVVLLLQGVFGLLGVTMGGFTALLGGVVAMLWPVALAIGGIILAITVFKAAYRKNLGGFGDFVDRVVYRVQLLWSALVDLFTKGGFSKGVYKELGKGHSGIKDFAIGVFLWWNRIKAFFAGIGEALGGIGEIIAPVFEEVVKVFQEVGEMFGFAFTGPNDPAIAASRYDMFRSVGMAVGMVLRGLVIVLAEVVKFWLRMVQAIAIVGQWLAPVVNWLVSVFGNTIKGVMAMLAGIIEGDFSTAWLGLKILIFGVLQSVLGFLGLWAMGVAKIVDGIAALFGKDLGAAEAVAGVRADMERSLARGLGVAGEVTLSTGEKTVAPVAATPARAGVGAPVAAMGEIAAARVRAAREAGMSEEQIQRLIAAIKESGNPTLKVELDGEKVAEVTAKANRSAAGRSFAPVPTV